MKLVSITNLLEKITQIQTIERDLLVDYCAAILASGCFMFTAWRSGESFAGPVFPAGSQADAGGPQRPMLSHSVRVKGPHKNAPRSLVKPRCRLMAQGGPSPSRARRSAYERIPDVRCRMSRFGWKTDGILEGAEGRSLTQSRHSWPFNFQL